MGERGELSSARVFAQNGQRTYFLNVKENRYRDLFLLMAESLKTESHEFNRFTISVFEEDLELFALQMERVAVEMGRPVSKKEADQPVSWDMASKSRDKLRFYRFIVQHRGRMVNVSLCELKQHEPPDASRRIRIEQEDFELVLRNFRAMLVKLFVAQKIRDEEPIRNPQLLEKYKQRAKEREVVVFKRKLKPVVVKTPSVNQSE
jgi:hypothetical protein